MARKVKKPTHPKKSSRAKVKKVHITDANKKGGLTVGTLLGKSAIASALAPPLPNRLARSADLESVSEHDLAEYRIEEKESPSTTPKAAPSGEAVSARKHLAGWLKVTAITGTLICGVILVVGILLSQYYKDRILPNTRIAGIASGSKTRDEAKSELKRRQDAVKLTIKTDNKTLEPKHEEIGYQVDIDKTTEAAYNAKRRSGIFSMLAFWQQHDIPATVHINDTLLNQFVESKTPELTKPPTDAQLNFDPEADAFVITKQADGAGPDIATLKNRLQETGNILANSTIDLKVVSKAPSITEEKLKPFVEPANKIISHRVLLTGAGRSFAARRADIAEWITPTPEAEGRVKLTIDGAKVQSYVDGIGKRISAAPQDKKIIKDAATGAELVLQEGRDGTTLTDPKGLADAITAGLNTDQDVVREMTVQVAAFKTVNMEGYDKWIEVDLSDQRLTAYEKTNPVKSALVATGMAGYATPVGEYAIWLKVRSQTMQGGSKADGSYYNLPNVEWVSYFYKDYAIHGAYWRKVFGVPGSHGCVNMTNPDAQWIFGWAPVGTKVIVHQ